MNCWIYKGSRRAETYLYLAGPDATEAVPDELLAALGTLEFVMELALDPDRTLARANPVKVIEELEQRGYYLQMPPVDTHGQGRIQ